MVPSYMRCLLAVVLLVSVVRADVQYVNRTIDDQYGDEVTGRLVRWAICYDVPEPISGSLIPLGGLLSTGHLDSRE